MKNIRLVVIGLVSWTVVLFVKNGGFVESWYNHAEHKGVSFGGTGGFKGEVGSVGCHLMVLVDNGGGWFPEERCVARDKVLAETVFANKPLAQHVPLAVMNDVRQFVLWGIGTNGILGHVVHQLPTLPARSDIRHHEPLCYPVGQIQMSRCQTIPKHFGQEVGIIVVDTGHKFGPCFGNVVHVPGGSNVGWTDRVMIPGFLHVHSVYSGVGTVGNVRHVDLGFPLQGKAVLLGKG